MIPEQTMDFPLLNMDSTDTFSYQPQVFTVLETPEPGLDAAVLCGKGSQLVEEQFDSESDKVEMPVIERPATIEETAATIVPVNEEFENDPGFALYHDIPTANTTLPIELDTNGLSSIDIFGGIEPEKMLERYELVNQSEEDASATLAMARVQRISANLDCMMARLEMLTAGL